jgi:pimeloyl-ACP methyl ester carboxylesterase
MHEETGGRGPDLLVMLHGLGATAGVWSPMRERAGARWAGRWLALDLPGHGGGERLASYAIGQCAAAVARAVLPHVDRAGRVVVLGHSFGGVIGMALATGWFGVTPHAVFGAGIKASWTDTEVERLASMAAQPAKCFATEAEAWERYLKVSGLAGLAAPGSDVAARGIAADGSGWRLAMDPAANGVGKPPLSELMGLARCPVHLARGGQDAMVTLAQTQAIDASAVDLGAHGHNVMVEAPDAVWDWIGR